MNGFDLKKALAGEKVIYRDGVEVIAINYSASQQDGLRLETKRKDDNKKYGHFDNGTNHINTNSIYDLFMEE